MICKTLIADFLGYIFLCCSLFLLFTVSMLMHMQSFFSTSKAHVRKIACQNFVIKKSFRAICAQLIQFAKTNFTMADALLRILWTTCLILVKASKDHFVATVFSIFDSVYVSFAGIGETARTVDCSNYFGQPASHEATSIS